MATLSHLPTTLNHSPRDPTFSTQMRQEFSQHRQEWTRFYLPLIEILRQRGLIARLDRLSRCSSSPSSSPSTPTSIISSKETLTVLAATTHVLSEWALKLHTPARWNIALNAINVVDDFSVAILTRLLTLSNSLSRCDGYSSSSGSGSGSGRWATSAAELGQWGAKVRASREALLRNLLRDGGSGARRAVFREQVFKGLLGWIERRHCWLVEEMVIDRVSGGVLPVELVEMVREGLHGTDGEGGGGGGGVDGDQDSQGTAPEEQARWDQVYASSTREESRVLARAGVARLEVSRSAAITA